MENVIDIKPGMSINLIAEIDIWKEMTDVRNAIVYDIDGVNIIISQTNPALTKYHIGRDVTITYLNKQKNGIWRNGFSGKVLNILYDYNLYSSAKVQAISIVRDSDYKIYDLRMHYRVKPITSSGIELYVEDEKVSLIDISVGGVRFYRSKKHTMKPGTIIEIVISLEGQAFSLDAKCVNIWHYSEYVKQKDFEYVSVQFLNMDKKCTHLLSGKILTIQRELLSKI